MDIGKVIREEDIMGIFEKFAGGVSRGCPAEEEAAQWLEWMKEDHLFVSAGVNEYVFIHSTVMEYLAARYIVEKINDPSYLETHYKKPDCEECLMQKPAAFFETEILPIAVGSGIKQGARIMRFIRDRILQSKNETETGRLYTLALKALVEFESFIDRQMQRKRLDLLHRELDEEVAAHWQEIKWVYLYLKNLLLSADKTRLKTLGETFINISRLSRPYFLERYVTVDSFLDGDSEIISMRKELLYKLINREIVEQWIRTWSKTEGEEGINLLTMDSIQYHPEDKNFNYYRGFIGKELTGIFGSPNFKHSGGVQACAFLPGGSRVVSASDDNTLKLWDVETGKTIRTFSGHTDNVTSCAALPDGRRLVSVSWDNTLKLWDIETGQCLKTLPLPWTPCFISISPAQPTQPAKVFIANLNGTVTMFDFILSN